MTVMNVLAGYGGSSGPIGGAWDPAKKSANITLSGGDLIATGSASSPQGVLGTVGLASGQGTFKTTVNAYSVGDPLAIGIGNASTPLNGLMGDSNSIVYFAGGFIRFNGSTPITGIDTYGPGDVIQTVFDMSTMTVFWNKNGVLVAGSSISFSGITGAVYAAAMLRQVGDQVTGNFTT